MTNFSHSGLTPKGRETSFSLKIQVVNISALEAIHSLSQLFNSALVV